MLNRIIEGIRKIIALLDRYKQMTEGKMLDLEESILKLSKELEHKTPSNEETVQSVNLKLSKINDLLSLTSIKRNKDDTNNDQ